VRFESSLISTQYVQATQVEFLICKMLHNLIFSREDRFKSTSFGKQTSKLYTRTSKYLRTIGFIFYSSFV